MKLIKLYIPLILIILLTCCKKQENQFILKGEISNLENQEILITFSAADTLAIDTIKTNKNGKFTYKNSIDSLTAFSLYLNKQHSTVLVFGNPNEKVILKGDAQIPDLIKVNGNEINDELTTFKENNKELLKQRSTLLYSRQQGKENDSIKNDKLLPTDEEQAQITSYNQELTRNAEEYIKENPTKMSSLILIKDFFAESENPIALERVLGYMQGDVMKSRMGLNLKAFSNKINRSAEGAFMPYFKLTDKDKKIIESTGLRGKYVLLSFVSASGNDSREAISALKKTYAKLKKDSLNFISIYIDSDIYPVDYLKQDSIPWSVVPEKRSWASDIVDTYNIQFIPNNILIMPNGTISDRNIPAVAVESALKNLLKKQP